MVANCCVGCSWDDRTDARGVVDGRGGGVLDDGGVGDERV